MRKKCSKRLTLWWIFNSTSNFTVFLFTKGNTKKKNLLIINVFLKWPKRQDPPSVSKSFRVRLCRGRFRSCWTSWCTRRRTPIWKYTWRVSCQARGPDRTGGWEGGRPSALSSAGWGGRSAATRSAPSSPGWSSVLGHTQVSKFVISLYIF